MSGDVVGQIRHVGGEILEVRESLVDDARQLGEVSMTLRQAGLRGDGPVARDVASLIEERRVLRWRLAEVQRALDDGYDSGDRRVIRVSRQVMHFILTGRLP